MKPILQRMVVMGALLCSITLGAQELNPQLSKFLNASKKEIKNIPEARIPVLDAISDYVSNALVEDHKARLLFVCTHNSRRSQMSQGMAHAAAAYYNIPFVHTYSGGIEETAFNPRAVKAMTDAGFMIEANEDKAENTRYEVKVGKADVAVPYFSKMYSSDTNPKSDFAAVMVCSDADEACPIVQGADIKIPLPYVDPKVSDGTKDEVKTYHERLTQIAAEQMYIMKNVKKKVKVKKI